jgi:hypothetical protein
VSATELQARMTNPALTPKQRADARRAYGHLIAEQAYADAEDFVLGAYGERVLPIQRGRR